MLRPVDYSWIKVLVSQFICFFVWFVFVFWTINPLLKPRVQLTVYWNFFSTKYLLDIQLKRRFLFNRLGSRFHCSCICLIPTTKKSSCVTIHFRRQHRWTFWAQKKQATWVSPHPLQISWWFCWNSAGPTCIDSKSCRAVLCLACLCMDFLPLRHFFIVVRCALLTRHACHLVLLLAESGSSLLVGNDCWQAVRAWLSCRKVIELPSLGLSLMGWRAPPAYQEHIFGGDTSVCAGFYYGNIFYPEFTESSKRSTTKALAGCPASMQTISARRKVGGVLLATTFCWVRDLQRKHIVTVRWLS